MIITLLDLVYGNHIERRPCVSHTHIVNLSIDIRRNSGGHGMGRSTGRCHFSRVQLLIVAPNVQDHSRPFRRKKVNTRCVARDLVANKTRAGGNEMLGHTSRHRVASVTPC